VYGGLEDTGEDQLPAFLAQLDFESEWVTFCLLEISFKIASEAYTAVRSQPLTNGFSAYHLLSMKNPNKRRRRRPKKYPSNPKYRKS